MVKLFCAVVGVGSVFPVDIELSETIGDLKKKIKEEEEYDFPASRLKLYLAREGDTWLNSQDEDIKALKKGEVPDRIKSLMQEELLLDEAWDLDNDAYFSKTFERAEDDIHVLVELPEDAALIGVLHYKRGAEELGDIIEARVSKVLAERDEKNSAYSFSDLNTEMEQRLVKKMRLVENVPTDIDEPLDTSIPGYSWIPEVPENGPNQRTGYMAYLRQHLSTLMDRGNFVLADIVDDESVLTIVDPRLPFRMNGTADVLLIKGTRMHPLIKLAGVCAVIELKKKVEGRHVPQAVGQLVSSSIKAPLNCYPLSLLTDLNDHWHFAWFSDKHVWTHFTLEYPKNAFKFLETFVLEGPRSTPFRLPFLSQPVKNLRVDDFLPMPVDTRAEEMMERYELMADVVEPEFLMARRMEYGQHLVQSMPAYAHMFE